jgi:hypothetical protein
MIKYSLKCQQGHEFESWFQSAAAYDDQAARKLVVCPACAGTEVTKAIMAPALAFQGEGRSRDTADEPTPPRDDARTPVALLDSSQQEYRAMLRAFRQKVLTETDDVGERFPEEARRIHEGDIPERAIHGRATLEEAKALVQEGIGILPLPILPEDFN